MSANWKKCVPAASAAALLLAALVVAVAARPALSQREAPAAAAAGPRYSVVATEGHNLIVTDNQSSTLYFYTVDKDKEIGSDLKLRGSIDLKQVGKPVLKPTKGRRAE